MRLADQIRLCTCTKRDNSPSRCLARISVVEGYDRAEAGRVRSGVQRIIDQRYAGDFDGLIPKMRALLAGD